MQFYDKLRFEIVPPLFLVIFTSSVQFLVIFGKDETITWNAVISGLIGNVKSWSIVAILFLWAYFWLLVANKETKGTITLDGEIPTYKANGVQYHLITTTTYLTCNWLWPNISYIIYDNMPQILGTTNIVAFTLCVYLYLRSAEGADLPKLYVFYVGRELHPTIFNVQIKQLIITRVSLMFWQIQVVGFFFTAWDRRGLDIPSIVTCLIQVIYSFKTFIYESAYFHSSLDITLDRAGYYLIWGCLVWVPCLFSYNSYYLVQHVPIISTTTSLFILIVGITAIIATALVDLEKDRFKRTNGKTLVWNKRPTYIQAEYTDNNGKKRKSLLLTSGFWGQARHLNYTFELLANLSWCITGYGLGLPVYLYIIFLSILILHRIYRDEVKCKNKYGIYWVEYCKKVPYRLVPYVF